MRSFAIIPAAGRSERMGSPKLLLPCGEQLLIERVLAAWSASRVDESVVVLHPEDRQLAEVCARSRATVVVANQPPPDMRSSVLCGLSAVESRWQPGANDVWLVAPADLPHLSATTINLVLAAYDPQAPSIVLPRAGDRRVHPVLFPWSLAAAARGLEANQGLNQLVRDHPCVEVSVPSAPEMHDDIDTPEDYRRWIAPPCPLA